MRDSFPLEMWDKVFVFAGRSEFLFLAAVSKSWKAAFLQCTGAAATSFAAAVASTPRSIWAFGSGDLVWDDAMTVAAARNVDCGAQVLEWAVARGLFRLSWDGVDGVDPSSVMSQALETAAGAGNVTVLRWAWGRYQHFCRGDDRDGASDGCRGGGDDGSGDNSVGDGSGASGADDDGGPTEGGGNGDGDGGSGGGGAGQDMCGTNRNHRDGGDGRRIFGPECWYRAAYHGRIAVLAWAKACGFLEAGWGVHRFACRGAAEGGSLAAVRWLRENELPWGKVSQREKSWQIKRKHRGGEDLLHFDL
ncbi:unnamed protein product [Phaeothamnion confervicola]